VLKVQCGAALTYSHLSFLAGYGFTMNHDANDVRCELIFVSLLSLLIHFHIFH
jgi:hypothetical protein